MNPMLLLQMQQRFLQFQQEHPRFMPFLTAVRDHGLEEGSVIDIKVTTPDGKNLATNIKLNANDMEAIQTLLNTDFTQ
ncbi:MAG: hypothetical protein II800_08995 [Lachnospiraceae bacterium]|nr:hypothetical protein [Lachnospiraceae bacterium]